MDLKNDEFACVMARFASTKIIMYRERYNRFPSEHQKLQSEINFEKKTFNGYMSKQTKSYITKILDLWYQSCKYWNRYYSKSNQASKKKLTFLTLTLPAVQIHTDNEIKRNILNHFIIACQRTGIFDYYFWRAEKQKNGNIHFHLLVDKFIDMVKLQELWCKCLEPYGYIKAYQDVYGSKLPPCTHIAEIPENQNIIDYVVKYVGKNECETKVEGRIWGMSDKLRDLIAPKELVDNEMMKRIDKYVNEDKKNVYDDENCTIVKIDFKLRQKYEYEFRSIVFDRFFKANCSYLYFDGLLPLDVLYPKKEKPKPKCQAFEVKLTKWRQQSLNFDFNL